MNSSQKAFSVFQKCFANDAEEFWVVALNADLEILDKKLLFRGTVDRCLIHARDIVRYLCLQNASSYVIAHNHPSGDPRPSKQDLSITKRILMISILVEIPLNDHLILAGDSYFSFADSGLLGKFHACKSLSLRS